MSATERDRQQSSEELFARAVELMPGGVNSPVRAFRGVGGTPRFIAQASGATMTDADGRTYIDYVGSWGPMILGHAAPEVIDALHEALGRGTSYGAPTELEVEMAEEIIDAVPSIEMVRMVNSGTEATMSALRLARGATGRDKIVKFEGCYDGHGVTASVAANTITAPFNDVAALEQVFDEHGADVAAVIVEPVVGNMGCVPPRDGYLQALRDITTRHGALLILDEVMTGFRLARGGAQELYGVTPDITTLGKIIGGGLPVGAYGGRRDLLEQIAPAGPVYQAGTLSGNPLAMTAGLAVLRRLRDRSVYERLEEAGRRLTEAMSDAAREAGVETVTNRVGSMFTTFFNASEVTDWTTAAKSDRERYGKFFHAMLEGGVYLAPSQFEAAFIGLAHTDDLLDRTVEAARKAFRALAGVTSNRAGKKD